MANGFGTSFPAGRDSMLFMATPTKNARLARNLLGQYQSLQMQAKSAHEKMSADAAKFIQDELRERVQATGRQQNVGNGRNSHLVRAIGSPKNRLANVDGFAVGLKDYMNSSKAAPYWRNLEYGSRVHVGRELRGFFLSRTGKIFPPSKSRRVDGRLIQTNTFFAKTKEQRDALRHRENLIKAGKAQRYANTYGRGGKLADPDGTGFKIIIKRPIPAYEYFAQGSLTFLTNNSFDNYYKAELKGVPYKPQGKKPTIKRYRSSD